MKIAHDRINKQVGGIEVRNARRHSWNLEGETMLGKTTDPRTTLELGQQAVEPVSRGRAGGCEGSDR